MRKEGTHRRLPALLLALSMLLSCAPAALAAETAAWVHTGYRKVLSGLPFQCLPGHIYGRGQYAALQRQLPGSLIVGVDYDASLRDATVDTRVRMLLDTEL